MSTSHPSLDFNKEYFSSCPIQSRRHCERRITRVVRWHRILIVHSAIIDDRRSSSRYTVIPMICPRELSGEGRYYIFSRYHYRAPRSRWSCSLIPFSKSSACNAFLFVDIDQSTVNPCVRKYAFLPMREDLVSLSWKINYFNNDSIFVYPNVRFKKM